MVNNEWWAILVESYLKAVKELTGFLIKELLKSATNPSQSLFSLRKSLTSALVTIIMMG